MAVFTGRHSPVKGGHHFSDQRVHQFTVKLHSGLTVDAHFCTEEVELWMRSQLSAYSQVLQITLLDSQWQVNVLVELTFAHPSLWMSVP